MVEWWDSYWADQKARMKVGSSGGLKAAKKVADWDMTKAECWASVMVGRWAS